jgi:hypothetical protein
MNLALPHSAREDVAQSCKKVTQPGPLRGPVKGHLPVLNDFKCLENNSVLLKDLKVIFRHRNRLLEVPLLRHLFGLTGGLARSNYSGRRYVLALSHSIWAH